MSQRPESIECSAETAHTFIPNQEQHSPAQISVFRADGFSRKQAELWRGDSRVLNLLRPRARFDRAWRAVRKVKAVMKPCTQ